jgi:CcmD family protein
VSALLAQLPALPLHEAGKYVAAAYVTLFVLVVVYVAVMAMRVGRIERELGELSERRGSQAEQPSDSGQA